MPFAEERGCPPEAVIEWIDTVKINDVQYEVMESGNYKVEEKDSGDVLGEVTYKMAGTACMDHKTQNGDAAFLNVGTKSMNLKDTKRISVLLQTVRLMKFGRTIRLKRLETFMILKGKSKA